MFTKCDEFESVDKVMKVGNERYKELFGDCPLDFVKKFFRFNSENPEIFKLFEKFAVEAKQSGRERFSHWMIINRIRWYTSIETTGKDFKISNDFIALYARALILKRPEFKNFFLLKQMKRNRKEARI